jgi:thioredoxin 1
MKGVRRVRGVETRNERLATARVSAVLLAAGLVLSACGGGGGSPTAASVSAPTPTLEPSAVVALDVGNFDERVLRADGVCLVEFYSPDCSHCLRMVPTVERLAVDYADRALVGRVNVQTETPLVRAWDILGWPTFVVVKDGTEVDRWIGETSYEQLAGMIEAALGAGQ